MEARASVAAAVGAGRCRVAAPLVLIDGALAEDVAIRRLVCTGPLGLREARISMRGRARERVRGLVGRRVEVVQPWVMDDGTAGMLALFAGTVEEAVATLEGNGGATELGCGCDLGRALEARRDAELEAEDVGGAIAAISGCFGLGLDARLLDAAAVRRPVTVGMLSGGWARQMLERLLRREGMVVASVLRWEQGAVRERRWVRHAERGRGVWLALGDVANPESVVQSLRAAVERHEPRKWVAALDTHMVESTWELKRGWEPSMEGLGAEAYGKSTSGDFEAVSNVHRLWVLNEDGAYSGEPYGHERFDVTALFEAAERLPARPLRFEPALTRDAQGRSLGVVVEMSVDGGATWKRYAGEARVLRDRAGVYLDDDVLEAGHLGGGVRVRVTASLRNPRPGQAVRWRGNPFAGSFGTVEPETEGMFAWRRVSPGSRFHAAVRGGELGADEVDDRDRMARWLVETAQRPTGGGGGMTITTARVMPWLGVGDGLAGVGRGVGADLGDSGWEGGVRAVLWRATHRWDGGGSTLEWEVV